MRIKKGMSFVLIAVCLCSQATFAEPLSVLLEKGIYTEETVGDVKKAITIYNKIIEEGEANRTVMAKALFRLGRCYAAEGNKELALKSLTALTKQYSEQKTLLEQAAKLMPSLEPGLQLKAAQWEDGEALHYNLVMKTGKEVGRQVWSADKVRHEGKACWKIQQQLYCPIDNTTIYSIATVDQETFEPYVSRTKHALGDVAATYDAGKVTLLNQTGNNASSRDVEFSGSVFDNEQAIYLIRRLPLKENYKGSFQVMSVISGLAIECHIQVLDREEVEVPAGSFDCWKVSIQGYSQGIKVVEQRFWFSVDEQVPVMMDIGHLYIKLAKKTVGNNQVSFAKQTISLTLPADWYAYEPSSVDEQHTFAYLLSTKANLTTKILANERGSAATTKEEMIRRGVKFAKDYYDVFNIRADSKKEMMVGGSPCTLFIADYENKSKKMVDYRAYYQTKTHIYWFVFQISADSFGGHKAAIDKVIQSVTFSNK